MLVGSKLCNPQRFSQFWKLCLPNQPYLLTKISFGFSILLRKDVQLRMLSYYQQETGDGHFELSLQLKQRYYYLSKLSKATNANFHSFFEKSKMSLGCTSASSGTLSGLRASGQVFRADPSERTFGRGSPGQLERRHQGCTHRETRVLRELQKE